MKNLLFLLGLLIVSCSTDSQDEPELIQTCYTLIEVTGLPCLNDNQETGVTVKYESEEGQELIRCFYPPEQAENNIGSVMCLSE